MKKPIWITAAFLLALTGSAGAVAIRLAHPDIDIVVKRGEKNSGVLTIENPTEETFGVRIYTEDWKYKDTGFGDKDFFPAGSLPNSAAKWISLNPVEVIMAPFSRREVNYVMAIPDDPALQGTYHAVIFYESAAEEESGQDGAVVLVSARLGTVVRVGIEGSVQRNGRIHDVVITPPVGSKPAFFDVSFENTGNRDVFLKGSFLILDASGVPQGRGALEEIITESGQTVTRRSEWAGTLAPGAYDVIITFDLGEGKLLTEERKLVVAG